MIRVLAASAHEDREISQNCLVANHTMVTIVPYLRLPRVEARHGTCSHTKGHVQAFHDPDVSDVVFVCVCYRVREEQRRLHEQVRCLKTPDQIDSRFVKDASLNGYHAMPPMSDRGT